jgi:hypothetical protein
MINTFKIIRNIFAIIGLISCILIAAYFLFLKSFLEKPLFDNKDIEVYRLSSPNKEYDLVITKYEPTSFTTPVYNVFIVPLGTIYSEKSDNFKFENYRSPCWNNNDIFWENNDKVIIKRQSDCRVYNFISEYYDPRYCGENKRYEDYRKINLELINY